MTWGEVSSLVLPQVWKLFEYWQTFPPAHFILKYAPWSPYRDIKPKGKKPELSEEDITAMMPFLGSASPMPPEIRDAIDWAEKQKARMGKAGRA